MAKGWVGYTTSGHRAGWGIPLVVLGLTVDIGLPLVVIGLGEVYH